MYWQDNPTRAEANLFITRENSALLSADSRSEGQRQGSIPVGSTMYLVCTASWPALPGPVPLPVVANSSSSPSRSSPKGSALGLGAARSAHFQWFHNGRPLSARGSGSSSSSSVQPQQQRASFASAPVVESHAEPAANRFTSTLRVERVDASCSGEYFCRVRVRFPGATAHGIQVESESGRILVTVQLASSRGASALHLRVQCTSCGARHGDGHWARATQSNACAVLCAQAAARRAVRPAAAARSARPRPHRAAVCARAPRSSRSRSARSGSRSASVCPALLIACSYSFTHAPESAAIARSCSS